MYIVGKEYEELGARQQQRCKKQLQDQANTSLNGIQSINVEPVSLQLRT